jgi:hypothetical protein
MKVVCINNTVGNTRHLELNCIYESIDYTLQERLRLRLPDNYTVILKNDREIWCDVGCFVTLENWRQMRINELGI